MINSKIFTELDVDACMSIVKNGWSVWCTNFIHFFFRAWSLDYLVPVTAMLYQQIGRVERSHECSKFLFWLSLLGRAG